MTWSHALIQDNGDLGKLFVVTEIVSEGETPRVLNIVAHDEADLPDLIDFSINPSPPLPLPDPVTIVPSVKLWERMTDAEAEQVEVAMASQPFRTRQIFMTAQTFRSDHELWSLLEGMATTLFGEERAGELLAAG